MRDRVIGLKSVPATKLRGFSAGNPKSPTDTELRQLGDSIDNHGYVMPIAVRALPDGNYEIIDGHSRLEVILARDPAAKIKVIVLDVDSVSEGRRILLALQHHVGFDTSKLEDFVKGALADGTTAADLMLDLGDVAAELEAFAAAASNATNQLAGGDDPNDPKSISRAGLTPEHVQFGLPLTREQSKRIHDAINLAKRLGDMKVSGDALDVICTEYLGNHKTVPGKQVTAKPRGGKGRRAR